MAPLRVEVCYGMLLLFLSLLLFVLHFFIVGFRPNSFFILLVSLGAQPCLALLSIGVVGRRCGLLRAVRLLLLVLQVEALEHEVADGRERVVRVHLDHALVDDNAFAGKERTVERERLVLAALAAHIGAEFALQGEQVRLHFAQPLAQMLVRIEALTGHLDEHGVEARVDHVLQQLGLVALPQVGERLHAQPFAYVLHSILLVRGQNGARRDGVHGVAVAAVGRLEFVLDTLEDAIEVLDLVAGVARLVLQVGVEHLARDVRSIQRQLHRLRVHVDHLVAHRLVHIAVDLLHNVVVVVTGVNVALVSVSVVFIVNAERVRRTQVDEGDDLVAALHALHHVERGVLATANERYHFHLATLVYLYIYMRMQVLCFNTRVRTRVTSLYSFLSIYKLIKSLFCVVGVEL